MHGMKRRITVAERTEKNEELEVKLNEDKARKWNKGIDGAKSWR